MTSLSQKRTLLSTVLFAYKQDSKSLVPVIEKAKMYASFHRFKNYFNLKLLVFNIRLLLQKQICISATDGSNIFQIKRNWLKSQPHRTHQASSTTTKWNQFTLFHFHLARRGHGLYWEPFHHAWFKLWPAFKGTQKIVLTSYCSEGHTFGFKPQTQNWEPQGTT